MRLDHAEDLAAFVSELQLETDRGLPLVGAALIDEKLLETLQSFFVEGKSSKRLLAGGNAPLGTLSSRVETCHALGLIDEFECSEISLVRKIRNEFAHSKHGISFGTERIKGLCASLEMDLPEGSDYPTSDPRFRFTNSIVGLALRLYYRPDWVRKERRSTKTWVQHADVRWRSVEDELPPKDGPFIAIGKGKDDRA